MTDFAPGGIAPDSRLSHVATPKGAFMGEMGWMEPSFCANCGKRGPDVPTENMTFMFWLCTPCFATHGEIAGTMAMPEQVFWQQVKNESIEKYGRELTHEELSAVVAADASPLATLIKERG